MSRVRTIEIDVCHDIPDDFKRSTTRRFSNEKTDRAVMSDLANDSIVPVIDMGSGWIKAGLAGGEVP